MRYSTLTAASLITGMTSAIPNIFPDPTPAFLNRYVGNGFTPRPTEGPNLELLKRGDLYPRTLTSGELIGYFAPDSTCGYISGSLGAVVTCPSGKCGAVAAISGNAGQMACCPPGTASCTFQDACYGSTDVFLSSKCDLGCQANIDNILCTSSASPFCVSYTWPDIDATSFACAPSTDPNFITVSFTWFGETDGRSWSSLYYTPSGTGVSTATSGGPNLLSSSPTTSTSSTTSSSSTSSSSGGGGGGSSSTNVGAIVGGVIGGLAMIGLIAFAIVFLLLRNRRANAAGTAGAGGAAGPPAPYDPNNPQMAGYYNKPAEAYNQQQRMSTVSNTTGSPAPGYTSPTGHLPPIQQGPTELDSSPVPASAISAQSPGGVPGHTIHEAPGN